MGGVPQRQLPLFAIPSFIALVNYLLDNVKGCKTEIPCWDVTDAGGLIISVSVAP